MQTGSTPLFLSGRILQVLLFRRESGGGILDGNATLFLVSRPQQGGDTSGRLHYRRPVFARYKSIEHRSSTPIKENFDGVRSGSCCGIWRTVTRTGLNLASIVSQETLNPKTFPSSSFSAVPPSFRLFGWSAGRSLCFVVLGGPPTSLGIRGSLTNIGAARHRDSRARAPKQQPLLFLGIYVQQKACGSRYPVDSCFNYAARVLSYQRPPLAHLPSASAAFVYISFSFRERKRRPHAYAYKDQPRQRRVAFAGPASRF